MSYRLARTDAQIDAVLNQAMEISDSGLRAYPGMTYEDGVRAALDWVTGQSDDEVFDEMDEDDGEEDEE